MTHRYADIAFTPTVKKVQEELGSRAGYARMEAGPDVLNHALGDAEANFIVARNSLYMGTVSETGWPYVQHRGGPPGFLRVLDESTIGFADFRGNRQYVSVGNLLTDDRVSIIFMDYVNKTRLKLFGHVRIVGAEDQATLSRLEASDYRARVERGFLIRVEGFDWHCPQHRTQRFTLDEVHAMTAPLRERVSELEARLAAS